MKIKSSHVGKLPDLKEVNALVEKGKLKKAEKLLHYHIENAEFHRLYLYEELANIYREKNDLEKEYNILLLLLKEDYDSRCDEDDPGIVGRLAEVSAKWDAKIKAKVEAENNK